MGRFASIAGVVLAVALACGPSARAATLTIVLDEEFSGATDPDGTLTAVFEDLGANLVELTLTSNLVGDEFVTWWGFNLDPALDPTLLTFTEINVGDAPPSSVNTAENGFKAAGDGFYDILFQWGASIFTSGESIVYTLAYTGGGLDALDFNFLSCTKPECVNAGGSEPFTSAAHVQGIGPSGAQSGWIGGDGEPGNGGGGTDGQTPGEAPEPASLLLLGTGLGLIAHRVRRKKNQV